MAGRSFPRLTAALVLVFGGTLLGVWLQRGSDGVLRTERWSAEILAAAREAGLDDPFLLAGLVEAESRGDPAAESSIGAIGLCQLLPGTAGDMTARYDIEGSARDPASNLRMGAHYLAEQFERFEGEADLALLAFRLGPASVQRSIEEAGGAGAWLAALRLQKPSPWEYRTKILRFRDRFRERAAAGVGWPAAAETAATD